MKSRIIITDVDFQRLNELVRTLRHAWTFGAYVNELERMLRRAHLVPAPDVPENVATVNSAVLARGVDGWRVFTLVLMPEPEPGTVSVIGPLGTALLGKREGDTANEVTLEKVLYQPEAAGDWHL